MRKLLARLAIIGTPAALVMASALPAHADFTAKFVCTAGSSVLCWSSDGTTGDLVFGKPVNPNNQQDSKAAEDPICRDSSGNLTATVQYRTNYFCPFTIHAWDMALQGHKIVTLGNNAFGDCFRGITSGTNSGKYVQDYTCLNVGEAFVHDNTAPTTCIGCDLWANVLQTDTFGNATTAEWICTNGANNPLVMKNPLPNPSCSYLESNYP